MDCDALHWISSLMAGSNTGYPGEPLCMEAVLVLLRVQGFTRLIRSLESAVDQDRFVAGLYSSFNENLCDLSGCLYSQLGDEFLFVLQAEEARVIEAVGALAKALADLQVESPDGVLHVVSRMALSRQKLHFHAIPGVGLPVLVPAAMDYLRELLSEAQHCRARVVVGEGFRNRVHSDEEFRLIALSMVSREDDPLGVFELLTPYGEKEYHSLLENRSFTTRAISCYHAGLKAEARELFFDALQKAPFDSLPGYYLNLIHREI